MRAQVVLDTICLGSGPTHLAVPYQAGLSYQWGVNGGQIIGRTDTNDVLIQWGAVGGVYQSWAVASTPLGCPGDTAYAWVYLQSPARADAKGPNVVCKGSLVTLVSTNSNLQWKGGKKQPTLSFVAHNDTTVYLVALNGKCGNDTIYHHIDVIDVPVSSISQISDSILLNESRRLYYTGPKADFIDWYVNGTLVSQTNTVLIDFNKEGTYEIMQVVSNGSGCADTLRKIVYVDAIFKVFIPTAFTPNGDGINDLFTFDGVGIAKYNVEIFNRWGEKVFQWNESSSVQGWDGTNNGQKSKIDTYVYNIVVEDQKGNSHYYQSYFNLLR